MGRITQWMGEHAAVVDNHSNYIDRLAYYEDLEEQGLLFVLPCKVGDTVNSKAHNWSGTVEEISICSKGVFLYVVSGGYNHLVRPDEVTVVRQVDDSGTELRKG